MGLKISSFMLLTLFFFHTCHSLPLVFLNKLHGIKKGNETKGLLELKRYFSILGYINTTSIQENANNLFDDSLESALKKYQHFYNLNATGILDQETIALLSQPRCGVADHNHQHESVHGSGLFTTIGSWAPDKRFLKYSCPGYMRTDAYTPLAIAIIQWKNVSPFKFAYTDDFQSADIKVSFERLKHGDELPFDGPSGIAGHTIFHNGFPLLHLDGDENWSIDPTPGALDMVNGFLHEMGHVLGLGHSKDPQFSRGDLWVAAVFAQEALELLNSKVVTRW